MIRLILSLALITGAGAELIEVPAEYLDTQSISLSAGDELRVYATDVQDSPNLDNVLWTGGTLRVEGCRFERPGEARNAQFPFVVQSGQRLELSSTSILDVDSALVVAGGEAILHDVTLAATASNIRSVDPASTIELHSVNICNAAVGVELQSCQLAAFENVLFLTNDVGLVCAEGSVSLQSVLFQANHVGLRIHVGAAHPVIGDSVDFVDAKDVLVENLDTLSFELGSSHLSHPAKVSGPTVRSGVDPGAPSHLLHTADVPETIDDETVFDGIFVCQEIALTNSDLPCRPTYLKVYFSLMPYEGFTVIDSLSSGEVFVINKYQYSRHFYRLVYGVGGWGY